MAAVANGTNCPGMLRMQQLCWLMIILWGCIHQLCQPGGMVWGIRNGDLAYRSVHGHILRWLQVDGQGCLWTRA